MSSKIAVGLILVGFLLSSMLTACGEAENSTVEIAYESSFIPLEISVDATGKLRFSVQAKVPTFLGTFSIGANHEFAEDSDVGNVLIVRMNGQEKLYDLHGQNFRVEYESGYYRKVSVDYFDGNILLTLERVNSSQSSEAFTERETHSSTDDEFGTNCQGVLPSRMVIGQRGEVTPGLPNRLRAGPSINTKQIDRMDAGDDFLVLDGPECNEYAWWKVNFNGKIGWTAEGNDNQYWIAPID